MASIVLSSAGAAIGNRILPGLGGRILGGYARRLGKWIDVETGLERGREVKDGPRLESLRVQDSRYGAAIPIVYGCARVAGNVIWCSSLIETAHESQTGGGKGGIIGGGASRTTYSYSVHCAVAVCAGEIGGIATVWADSKIIYQNGVWKSGTAGTATFYYGSATQSVDPLMESIIGSGQVPAYRGIAYVVFESLQLGDFGNRLPNLTFEVLPVETAPQPSWLGAADAGISNVAASLRNGGMQPIVTGGDEARACRMLVGGYEAAGGSAKFSVVEFDVTGESPVEVARAQSAGFAVSNVGDHSWALAPDGRFAALYLQSTGSTPGQRLAIYDTENRSFGNVLCTSMDTGDDSRQTAWLDAHRFAVTDVSGGRRGVRVFARAGLDVVDLGFFDVWGAGTAGARVPFYYAQFIPMAGGLLNLMSDRGAYFTAVYACHIFWRDGEIAAGQPYTVMSGFDSNIGAGPQARLLRTGDGEWTLFFSTAVNMSLMSFRPGTESAVVTRPWRQLVNSAFSSSTACAPMVFGGRIAVMQRGGADNFYRISEIALVSGEFELAADGIAVSGFSGAVSDFGAAAVDGERILLLGLKGFDNRLEQCGIVRRRRTGDSLEYVVSDILARAGCAGDDYDASGLAEISVDGFVIDENMTAAEAIEPLRIFEPFDLVESGGRLTAKRRGQTPSVSIPAQEYAAPDGGEEEEIPARRGRSRTQEMDLPLEVRIDYADAWRGYEAGSQRARRAAARGAGAEVAIKLPLVCTAAKAKQIAEARLRDIWAERERTRFGLSRRWLALEPGDVAALEDGLVRVESVKRFGGLLEVEGVMISPTAEEVMAGAESGGENQSLTVTSADNFLYLMDLPPLRAEDDQPGFYAAASGIEGWAGASLWRAAGDGADYVNAASFSTAAVAGIAVTALPDGPPWYMDRAGEVRVQLLRGSLSSCTEADLLNGANAALLGGEIIQFQTAALLGPGLYSLGNLLRGRRGTEAAAQGHCAGERFVLLTGGAVQFVPARLTDRGRACKFRAPSTGQALGDAPEHEFTYGLATLRPLAPVHIAGARTAGAGSDLVISWKRCARINADWIDNVDVPLDEPAELYDVEIMDGANVVRVFSGVASTSRIYSAAEQVADWGTSVPERFTVNVYQIGARYGRGAKGSAEV